MPTSNIQTLDDLLAASQMAFPLLQPCPKRPGKFTLSLYIDSYAELHFLMLDIIKVSIAALDAAGEEVTSVRNTHSAVNGVLALLLQMVPLEEMQLLDKIHELQQKSVSHPK